MTATDTVESKQFMSLITPEEAGTLDGLFRARVTRTPDAAGLSLLRSRTRTLDGIELGRNRPRRWPAGRRRWRPKNLRPGDRVAVMVRNCPEWMMFDQAALANGLVVVPLYTQDRAENIAYILRNAGVRLLLIGDQGHWESCSRCGASWTGSTASCRWSHIDAAGYQISRLNRGEWLPDAADLTVRRGSPDDLATIVYTSGTTGAPRGSCSATEISFGTRTSGLRKSTCRGPDDVLLSFLPLSHTLERTAGYYLPMMSGATVAYNRSISQLAEDLLESGRRY